MIRRITLRLRMQIIISLGLPRAQQNERSALCLLNNRPRKALRFKTPVEVYQEELLKLTKTVALQT
jgi:IS30 family transposase